MRAVRFAHERGRKVYVTLNIIPMQSDMERLPAAVRRLAEAQVDAVIVADLGVLDVVREHSELPVHVSTQASNTNWRSVRAWHRLGASRVILARELPLDDIRAIKDAVPEVELEAFVHGAMCVSMSGRCLLSAVMTGRDGNRGTCTHPCRWKYALVEEKRPGEYFPIVEDERGTYIMNSRDLCAVEFLDRLVAAGVDSLKIEGRIKGAYYAAVVTKIYREALDSLLAGRFAVAPHWVAELASVSNRGFTPGFYLAPQHLPQQRTDSSEYLRTHAFVGKVTECVGDEVVVAVRNRFDPRLRTEVISPHGPIAAVEFSDFRTAEEGTPLALAHANFVVRARASRPLQAGDLLRQPMESAAARPCRQSD